MKHQQLKYIVGYTVVYLKGHAIEELMQACIRKGYPLWNVITISKNTYQITCYSHHIPNIQTLAEYHNMEITILKTKGGLRFLRYIQQKRVLFTALFICALLFFLVFNTAWKVEVNGVSEHLEDQIKTNLKEKGLYQGAWIKNLTPLETIQEELLHDIPELLYIGIKKQGINYYVEAIEKKMEKEIEYENSKQLIAKKSGIIQKMFIETGQSLVERNDYVQKGDVLVTNEIETDEADDKEKTKKKRIPVRGKVYANTWYEVTATASKSPVHQKLTGDKTKSYRLKYHEYSFPIWGFGKSTYQQQMIEEDSKTLQLWKWRLPFEIVEETKYEYEGHTTKNNKIEVTEETIESVQKALKTKIGQNVEILEYYVLHEEEESGKVKMNIYFSVLENIAIPN